MSITSAQIASAKKTMPATESRISHSREFQSILLKRLGSGAGSRRTRDWAGGSRRMRDGRADLTSTFAL